MGSRSRKRGRTRPAGSGAADTSASGSAAADTPAAGSVAASTPPSGSSAGAPPPSDRAAKTEAKNAAVRATLKPLEPGERPRWVTYAALFALTLGGLNVVLYLAGVRVPAGGQSSSRFGASASAIIQGAVLLIAAAGMWRAKYWAVLGFEVLMGVTTAFGALSLLVASSLRGALIAVGVVLVCGTFFWKLIRAMARIQMPQRPGAREAER